MTEEFSRRSLLQIFDWQRFVTYRPVGRKIYSRDEFMVEILCTITGILAGVAIVASIMQARGDKSRWQAPQPEADDLKQPEQMKGIADQLRLISYRVAADVTAHSEKVEAINDRLHEPSAGGPDQILSAINELIAANQHMQSQLADARKRIADQSEMIEEASQQARTDALTGLANRRALNEFLQNCFRRDTTR